MRLTAIPALLIDETVRTWRRRLIAGAVVIGFGVLAIGEGLSALRLALHAEVGPMGARLILTGLFLAIVIAAMLIFLWREKRAAAARAARGDRPFGGDERVGAIAEAIVLGYSLAQDFRRSWSGNGAAREGEPAADAAGREAEASHHGPTRRAP